MNIFLLSKSKITTLGLIIILVFFRLVNYGQSQADNPNLDQIPQWYLEQARGGERMPSQVITIDYFDNFYLGVDFAEGHISVNPQAPTEFFTAFNVDAAHYTLDGHDWFNSQPAWGTGVWGDPVTAYDSLGNIFYENMFGSSGVQGCKVVRSDDNGQTWNTSVTAIIGNDKNWIACDQTAGPYANYVYSTMTNSGVGNFTRSTDHGETWTSTFAPSTQSLPGMMVCVGAYQNIQGGAVYVVTNSGSSFASTYTFYRSLDGGSTFQMMSAQNFAGYVGSNVNGRNAVENMRTRPYPFIAADNSFGPHRGRLYLVYAKNDPPGNGNKPDIWSRYSDDGGVTWTDAKRVNSGLFPQNSHQWQPATWCDKETGRLYVQWMDTRDTPTNDSALIYATYSDDGGQTFMAGVKVSNEKMKINCNTCGGGGTPRYQGDYNAIVSNPDVSQLTWGDFRWGSFASFTAYFPDFAMRLYPEDLQIAYRDTLWAVVPHVKLYDNAAIFSTELETPPSGTFTVSYPNGDTLTSFPDSIPIVITVDGVPTGSYSVTIKGEGPNGTPVHYREATIEVIPLPPPVADFMASDTSTCVGSSVDFTDLTQYNPTNWQWTFEGGDPSESTEQNPAGILYNTPGSYDVSLTVVNNTGSDDTTKIDYITVHVIPDPPEGDDRQACVNEEIPPLEATGDNIRWYSDPTMDTLVFEGDVFETGQTEPGVYPYYVTQNMGGCESPAKMITLTIFELPEVTLTPFDAVCLNTDPFELTNGQPEGGTYFGPGVEDGVFDASLAGEGTYTIGYVFTNGNSCSDTAFQDITVLPLPEVTLEPQGAGCVDSGPVDLTGGSPEGGEYWGDGITDNMFYPEEAGVGEHLINYTWADTNGCSNTASQPYTVYPLPAVNIGNDTSVCGDVSMTLNAGVPGAVSYLWTPGNYTTPTITVDTAGIGLGVQEHSVLVTDENGCSNSDTIAILFLDCTGIDEIDGLKQVTVFPNPSSGIFTLNIVSAKPLELNMKVFNVSGVMIYGEQQLSVDGSYSEKITLSNAGSGIYYILLENGKGKMFKKILIR